MQVFPHELFYEFIIPPILAERVHEIITKHNGRFSTPNAGWDPFVELPKVSKAFRDSVGRLYRGLFGAQRLENEHGRPQWLSPCMIVETQKTHFETLLVTAAEYLVDSQRRPHWERRAPPRWTYHDLTCNKSVVQAYICLAVAELHFTYEIRRPLALREDWLESGEDWESLPLDILMEDGNHDALLEDLIKVKDETSHRVYMPLVCAMKLCDDITPQSLAEPVTAFIAERVSELAMTPYLIKHAQHLTMWQRGPRSLGWPQWTEWTYQTLDHIENAESFLDDILRQGEAVRSLVPYYGITFESFEQSDIVGTFYDFLQSLANDRIWPEEAIGHILNRATPLYTRMCESYDIARAQRHGS